MVLVPWFMKGSLFSKAVGITGIASFVLGVASFLHRSVINEIFGLSVALMFILMIIYSSDLLEKDIFNPTFLAIGINRRDMNPGLRAGAS